MCTVVITKEREKKRKVDIAVLEKDGIPVMERPMQGSTCLSRVFSKMSLEWCQHWSSSVLLNGTNIGPVKYF